MGQGMLSHMERRDDEISQLPISQTHLTQAVANIQVPREQDLQRALRRCIDLYYSDDQENASRVISVLASLIASSFISKYHALVQEYLEKEEVPAWSKQNLDRFARGQEAHNLRMLPYLLHVSELDELAILANISSGLLGLASLCETNDLYEVLFEMPIQFQARLARAGLMARYGEVVQHRFDRLVRRHYAAAREIVSYPSSKVETYDLNLPAPKEGVRLIEGAAS